MSEKANSASHSQNRTDTMIGAGMRIEGNLAFTGVLRIQGNVHGDVTCEDTDPNGTIVADSSGSVSGTIKAPHVVVKGQVDGPVHSSQSIQVQQGGSVAGDVFYKKIEIHQGGVIEGALTPTELMDGDQSGQEHRTQALEQELPMQHDYGGKFTERWGRGLMLGGAAMLIVVVFALGWLNKNPFVITPPADDVALKADSTMKSAAETKSPSPGSEGLQAGGAKTDVGDAVPPLSGSNADAPGVVQTSPAERRQIEAEKVVTVRGVNPGKPADFFWLISKEPSVLLKKKRQDPADGTRIDVPPGKKISIAIAENEIFRVVEGRGVEILYQGRKVGPKTIETDAWMSFVPQPR